LALSSACMDISTGYGSVMEALIVSGNCMRPPRGGGVEETEETKVAVVV